MTEAIQVRQSVAVATWNHEQKELIRRTVAPGSTDDELAMFLHIAAKSELDPLLRQIHFLKVGGRFSAVADINGLQARAAREPDYQGIEHAVVYEKDDFQLDNKTGEVLKHTSNPFANGRPVGAWAVVWRKGMKPFRSVISFAEYFNQNNPLWKSKPAVMVDKCAKSTALRLAYPEQLGGVYEEAELGREEVAVNNPPPGNSRTEQVKAKIQAALAPKDEPPADAQKPESSQAETLHQARTNALWLTAKTGMTKAEFQKWTANVIGRDVPSKEWTEDEVGQLEAALPGLIEERQ